MLQGSSSTWDKVSKETLNNIVNETFKGLVGGEMYLRGRTLHEALEVCAHPQFSYMVAPSLHKERNGMYEVVYVWLYFSVPTSRKVEFGSSPWVFRVDVFLYFQLLVR